MAKKEKEKSYIIKVPVFTTTMKDDTEGLFGKTTFSEMVDMLKKRINDFKSEVVFENRNKTKKTVISKINFMRNISAYFRLNSIYQRRKVVFILVANFTFPNGYNIPPQSGKFLQTGFISFTV
ncbi:MAG: hypothetical protein LBP63_08875 [Prevotellaceae bacterium]|jgi:hypothetical protein|nr:hypothetical protein [Prevotellaceae bacterium]